MTHTHDSPDTNPPLILEGRKAILEALREKKPIDRLLVRDDGGGPTGTLRMIVALAREQGVVVQLVVRQKLDATSETKHHQGVIALCPAVPYHTIADILGIAAARGEDPLVVVLDGITDPHNLGAVMRTAEAGGAHGIVLPKRRAVGLTGTVSKTSAGAINHIAVARVSNISNAIAELKAAGLWIAAAAQGRASLFEANFTGPLAIVLGAEGSGISSLVAKRADFFVGIPMLGKVGSLNVSVAAGLCIYEAVRQRQASP